MPGRYQALVCAYAAHVDLDRRRLFRQAGLGEHRQQHADAVLTIAEFEALLLAVSRMTGRADAIFEIARSMTFESHGAFGLALGRCETIDHALRLLSRYYALITPSFLVEYRRRGSHADLTYRPAVGMERSTLATLNEIHAVSFHFILRSATRGQISAYDIYLPMDAPPYAERFRELSPARVHFGASHLPEVRIVLSAAIVDMRMHTRRADADQPIESMGLLEDALRSRTRDAPWAEWVRLVLREAEECRPTIGQVAALVRMPAHTLARRLANEGCRFRDIANAVSHERACALLQHSDATIGAIAHRLGYSGSESFAKAFRGLAHLSPREFRVSGIGAARLRSPARAG